MLTDERVSDAQRAITEMLQVQDNEQRWSLIIPTVVLQGNLLISTNFGAFRVIGSSLLRVDMVATSPSFQNMADQ